MFERVHFIGIAGIGQSALARLALQRGYAVSGSDDKAPSFVTGAQKLLESHTEGLNTATVVYSTAVSAKHPQRHVGRQMHRSEFLGKLMHGKKALCVLGNHGKSSTSAMLAHCLKKTDPSYAIGALYCDTGVNAAWGKGPYFVAEADESDGSFVNLPCDYCIVTNIDDDHIEHYGTLDAMTVAIRCYIEKIPASQRILCADDARLRAIDGIFYGFYASAKYRIVSASSTQFSLQTPQGLLDFPAPLPGAHFVQNASAVVALCMELGIPYEKIKNAFNNFPGIKRRSERLFEERGAVVVDDYGHHPTAVEATIQALCERYTPCRTLVILEPHRYSRTQIQWTRWPHALLKADKVFIPELYGAGESPIHGITSQNLVQECVNRGIDAEFVPTEALLERLASLVRAKDLVIFFGAGKATLMAQSFAKKLHSIRPLRCALLTGGQTFEHDVCLKSYKNVRSSIDEAFFESIFFLQRKDGVWEKDGAELSFSDFVAALQECDLAFPVIHGEFGEDGRLQALFECLGLAYAGCDWRAAAICMDKVHAKEIVAAHGIPIVPYVSIDHEEWEKDKKTALAACCRLGFPLFVKPCNGGSTVGVCKVERVDALEEAIGFAFDFGRRLCVEKGLEVRELEFAVAEEGFVAGPGEILTGGKIYGKDTKYGSTATPTTACADIDDEVKKTGQEYARVAYKALSCQGMCRVDFFYTKDGQWYFNEANPIPGLTPTSLYIKIFEHIGVSSSELFSKIFFYALRRFEKEQKRRRFGMAHLQKEPIVC